MTQLENAQHVEVSSPDSSEDLENSNKPSKCLEKKQKPNTHENTRSGVLVSTYKENGRTYCDLKVEIPWKWKDYSQLLITTIIPSNDPKKGVWYPFCQEVNNKTE